MAVPDIRVRPLNENSVNADGAFVLYWMIANRRTRYNFSLDRAVELASELGKPLLIFEALRMGYRWASDRIHRFVLQGMMDNRRALARTKIGYYAYAEKALGDGKGLLEALAKQSCAIVTDDFPCFFIPRMLEKVSPRLPVRVEAIDSNGLLPMRAADRVFPVAHAFRRFLQKQLPSHLGDRPKAKPFARAKFPAFEALPASILKRWPEATDEFLEADTETLAALEIDHLVSPAIFDGGMKAAGKALDGFLSDRLGLYCDSRNEPEKQATSGLSPYLHFGHVSAHEVFDRLIERENWSPDSLPEKATGKRAGWWNMSEEAESFLDELITWREVGYNMCWQRDDYDQYESLPDWAKISLEKHTVDRREYCYAMEEFEGAKTHDRLWNAAQNQLVSEGRMHNYLRMLWGKKVLEWSPSPQSAVETLIHLNNKYAVDGRNPNSYSGIMWCFGRYDRAWGPERPIFGKIRYMSSDNTARKLKVKGYLAKYADLQTDSGQQRLF